MSIVQFYWFGSNLCAFLCAKSVAAVLFVALFRAERKPSGLFGLTACAAALAFFEPVLLTRKL